MQRFHNRVRQILMASGSTTFTKVRTVVVASVQLIPSVLPCFVVLLSQLCSEYSLHASWYSSLESQINSQWFPENSL